MTLEQPQSYTFIVTGATGKIGRNLIPLLARRGHRILAVGRDPAMLRQMFGRVSGVDLADYDGLARKAACEALIHLAVHNNDKPGTLADFLRVNVDFTSQICEDFNRMGGKRFINISSIQTLDGGNESAYAKSKAAGQKRIFDLVGRRLDNVHIGYFYGDRYFGEKFALLSRLGPIGRGIFRYAKILKPTTSASHLADYVSNPAKPLPPPGILTDDLNKEWIYRTVCRTSDMMVGLIILVGLLPIFLVLGALIRIDSPGPAFFAQTRVGKGEARFTLYKFRTMKQNTISAGTHEVDPRVVTKVGKFLRRTKLDELPQAINLLRGEMTLVGPRPCLPVQEQLVRARRALGVFSMTPGITGYSQVRKIDMSRPCELAQSDYIYMKLQSLLLNCRIILLTVLGRGSGDRIASLEQL